MHLVGVLEASWGVLGASWVENGGQHGSNLAPKTEQKSKKTEPKNDQDFDASWNRSFWDFGGFEEVKRSQVGTKIASKIDSNFEKQLFERLEPTEH